MPQLDLDAIQARADAADDGPWGRDEHSLYVHNAKGQAVADFDWHARTREEHEQLEVNAAFVEYARTDVPDLVAAVRRVRQICDDVNPRYLACKKLAQQILAALDGQAATHG